MGNWESTQEQKLTLAYWPIRGRTEKVRLLLEYVGLAYDQKFYSEKKAEEWFKVDKPRLTEKCPAVNLPYLVDGDKLISQTNAIIVYICYRAKRTDLLGRNCQEQILLAAVSSIYADYFNEYLKLAYGSYTESSWEEALKNYSVKFQVLWKKINGLLGKKEYICGEITWVDFALADAIQVLNQLSPTVLSNYPLLKEYQKRVWNLAELQPYFNSERWHDHPVNGEEAKWR